MRVEFWRNDPGTSEGFSHPSTPIWGVNFGPDVVTERLWGDGDQGWYDPVEGAFTSENDWPDHREIYQSNIDVGGLPPNQLFYQEGVAGAPAVCWLLLKVTLAEGEPYDFGWKTSLEQIMDDAVYDSTPAVWPPTWEPMKDPSIVTALVSLDMAFVLNSTPVPEPGTCALIGTGLLGLLSLRRRR
ncbi:MAG: PEP-CTERM sorting domain-containing protein [Verrucomicrobia bacterium]|nr:PEP-CTERM sorting domain-containing protein [Verrucomicrobiota bacterium]